MPVNSSVIRSSHRGFFSKEKTNFKTSIVHIPTRKIEAAHLPQIQKDTDFDIPPDIVAPPEEWVNEAAGNGAKLRPFPRNAEAGGLVSDFREAVYCYSKLILQHSGWVANPVYEMLRLRLLQRLDETRWAILSMSDQFLSLEAKAKKYHWPRRVLQEHLHNLDKKVKWQQKVLDIVSVVNFQRQRTALQAEISALDDEITELWVKGGCKQISIVKISKRLNRCETKRRELLRQRDEAFRKQWKKWLEKQVTAIFNEVEARFVEMALHGKRQADWNPHGYVPVRCRLNESRSQHIVLLCTFEADGSLVKIHHVLTAQEYRKRKQTRFKRLDVYQTTYEQIFEELPEGVVLLLDAQRALKAARKQKKMKSERFYRPQIYSR